MKKALITILLIMTLSAGIYFSAFSHVQVSADELTPIDTLEVSGDSVEFHAEYGYYDVVQVQYTYLKGDILISRLDNIETSNQATRISDNWNLYRFTLPENALSFVIKNAMDGLRVDTLTNNEYILSEETRVVNADMSVRQLVINDDLIVKRPVWSDYGQNYEFTIHFNIDDPEGNEIPIDRIVSATYNYDVIYTSFGLDTIESKEVTIDEYTYYEAPSFNTMFPFIVNDWFTENIGESDEEGYTWAIDLGTYRASTPIRFLTDVTIDGTQMIHIEYWSEGSFIATDEIIDDEYDSDDIEYQGWQYEIEQALAKVGKIIRIIIYVIAGILVILLLLIIFKLFSLIDKVYKLIKYVFKFIFIRIPKGIVVILKFMFIPRKRRKERRSYHGI